MPVYCTLAWPQSQRSPPELLSRRSGEGLIALALGDLRATLRASQLYFVATCLQIETPLFSQATDRSDLADCAGMK